MSFGSINHNSKATVTIDRIEMDLGRVVRAVNECTAEVVKLNTKKLPTPQVTNEIVTPPAVIHNDVAVPQVLVDLKPIADALKSLRLTILAFLLTFLTVSGSAILWVLYVFGIFDR